MNGELENDEARAEDLNGNAEGTQEQEQEIVIDAWKVENDNEPEKQFSFQKEEPVIDQEEEINNSETTEQETIEDDSASKSENSEYVELDEDYAIKFLAEKRGLSVDEFKQTLEPKEKEVLDPETEAYLKYKKETGRSYNDFLQTQKDWSAEPQEDVLRHILKNKYPDLDDDEIEFKFRKQYSYDPDYDDDDVIMEKKINLKTDYREALALLESQKEQYKAVRSSDEYVPENYRKAKEIVDNWQMQQKENETAMAQARLDFEAKTKEVFTDNFEGFKFKVGDKDFSLKPEDVNQTKSVLSDVSNFDKKFFSETGQLKDPQGYYKALYAGMYADKIFEQAYNLGKVAQAEDDEKESKNIKVDGVKNLNPKMSDQRRPWTVEKD